MLLPAVLRHALAPSPEEKPVPNSLRTGIAAMCVVPLLSTAGCGAIPGTEDERSPEAFCKTYWEQKDQYVSKYNDRSALSDKLAEEDPMSGMLVALGSSVEALGDIVIIFDHLADKSPDDIRPDVEAIRDAMQKNIDNAGENVMNPLGGLASGLVGGLTTMGSWQRVGDYVVDNCGEKP